VAAEGTAASEVRSSGSASGGKEEKPEVAEVAQGTQLEQGLVSFPLKKACCC